MAALPMAVIGLTKTIVDRPRPSTARGVLMPDPSFPSGHTACSVVVVSLALFMLQVIDARIKGFRRLTGLSAGDSRTPAIVADSAIPQSPVVWRGVRAVLTVVLIIVPFVVAFSRVVYGVHYPTDVGTSLVLTPVLMWCVYRLCEPMR
nr:phosphatase PAP2 family protein [Bifidobacterium boum]